MKLYILEESQNPSKKYSVIRLNPSLKYISFGQRGANDFTISRDEDKKRNYLARHKPNENWENSDTAGFWARWLLWNKPSLEESIHDIESRFPTIKIVKRF